MKTEWNGLANRCATTHGLPYEIEKEVWHKASNKEEQNAHIEQWGSECIEEDIERRD